MARHKLQCSILADTDLSTTAHSKWVRLENIDRVSVQVTWTGAGTAGAFSVELSDDEGDDRADPANPTITNITTASGSSQTVAGVSAAPIMWDFEGIGARWLRVTFTRTGGTGVWTVANVTGKGAG